MDRIFEKFWPRGGGGGYFADDERGWGATPSPCACLSANVINPKSDSWSGDCIKMIKIFIYKKNPVTSVGTFAISIGNQTFATFPNFCIVS